MQSLISTLLFATIGFSQDIPKDFLMGKFKPSENASFVKIGASDHYLHKETFCAFQRMQHEAAKAKIKLTIVSATRTFEDQKTLWENKWNGKKAVNCQRRSESHLNLAV